MEIIIQLKKELADVTLDGEGLEVIDWHPALRAAADEVVALNLAFGGDNPIYVNADAITLVPLSSEIAEHWEGKMEEVFNSTPPSDVDGFIRIPLPNFRALRQSLFPWVPTTFTFCWGEPSGVGSII